MPALSPFGSSSYDDEKIETDSINFPTVIRPDGPAESDIAIPCVSHATAVKIAFCVPAQSMSVHSTAQCFAREVECILHTHILTLRVTK